MLRGRNPSVSSTAISGAREATAAYIVFTAPNTAPTAMIAVIMIGQDPENSARAAPTAWRRTRTRGTRPPSPACRPRAPAWPRRTTPDRPAGTRATGTRSRRMAGMICSFSPQISDSNADPAGGEVAGHRPRLAGEVHRLADAGVGKPPDQPPADADLVLARSRGACPSTSATLFRTCQACSLTPRTTTLASLVVSPIRPSGMTTYTSGLASGRPSAPRATCGEAVSALTASRSRPLDISESAPFRSTSTFRSEPGAGERRGEAVGEREHADEHRHHEPDAERGERGGDGALADAPHVVGRAGSSFDVPQRRHYRQPRRRARAGTMPLASMSSSAMTAPIASVWPVTSKPGRKPAALKLVAL